MAMFYAGAVLLLTAVPFATAQAPIAVAGATNVVAALGSSSSTAESLPNAPGEETTTDQGASTTATPPKGPQQTKRILGIVPNFRSVSAGVTLPPQTPKEKFVTGLSDSFDYSAVIFAGIQAGISQATKAYPAFHQGAAGYGRYCWHQFADQADENLLVESVLPTVLHQDSRYYTLGHGGFVKRSVYAGSRVLLTRKDDGGETFNTSEILGAGGAAAISATYYPGQYRTWTKVGQRWLTNVILDGATLYVKEFWPDLNRKLSHSGE